MAIRTHLSKQEIERLLPVAQGSKERAAAVFKPCGLWYSVDGGWEEWCASDMEGWLVDRIAYQLDLDGENILWLKSEDEIRAFDEQYAEPAWPGAAATLVPNWARVAELYDGIEISPYCWNCRYDLLWYYGWDCASGCLWQPRAARLTKLPNPVPAG